jgi:hypothetical protein
MRDKNVIRSDFEPKKKLQSGLIPGSMMKHFGVALKPRIKLDSGLISSPSARRPDALQPSSTIWNA